MSNAKFRIQFVFATLILIVTAIVTLYNLFHEQEESRRRSVQSYEFVHRSYDETLKDAVNFYTARANANLNSPGVLEAFRERDHDRLNNLIRPRWEVMQRENDSLIVMQFHNADGTSLLRLHQPDVYGDNIAEKRPMVAYVHRTQNRVYGFEEGRRGLAFRILIPIFDGGKYIGAVEFGINTPYFTDKIHRFTGYDSFFFIHRNVLGTFGRIKDDSLFNDYIGMDVDGAYKPIIRSYAQEHHHLENAMIRYGSLAYEVNVLRISNYQKNSIGAIMFIKTSDDFSSHVRHIVLINLLISMVLIIIVMLIVHNVYEYIIDKMSFQERYSQLILDSVPSPVIVTDGKQLIGANDTFLSYLHFESVAAFQKEHACVCEYFEKGDTDEYLMPMRDDQRWTEYVLQHPNDNHKAKITIDNITTVFEVKISVLEFNDQMRYVVIFNDISIIQKQTLTDPLTGIANRLHFTMVYQHALKLAEREKNSVSLIIFDIDHFKRVNDFYGHLEGDVVLHRIASLVQQRIRKSDLLARWGGEEFIILLPDTDLENAVKVAESLRNAVAMESFDTVGTITCSFGVATNFEFDESPQEFIKRADNKLYESKETGRNRVSF